MKTYKGGNLSLLLDLNYSSNFPLFFKKTLYFEKHAHTQKFI